MNNSPEQTLYIIFAVAAGAVHCIMKSDANLYLSNFSDFLSKKFLNHDKSSERPKYCFETTATDTRLVSNIIASVQTIVINMILKEFGLMK